MAKEKLVETKSAEDGFEETWQMRITDVRFSAGGGEIRADLHRRPSNS